MAWSLPTQECVHHIVWQLLGKSPNQVAVEMLPGKNWTPTLSGVLHPTASLLLWQILGTPNISGHKFVVNYLFLWQTMHHGKTWRPPTTVWSIFCSCPDSQSHVQTGTLRKFSLEDWATSFRKLFSQVVTSLLCSHDRSFISCPGLLSGP